MTRNRHSDYSKNITDYIIPIVGVVLVLIIIYNFAFGGKSQKEIYNENVQTENGIDVSLDSETTEAYIVYPWDYKKKIDGTTDINIWEKIYVKQWAVKLRLKDSKWILHLNERWELKFNGHNDFSLYSSDLWVDSNVPLKLQLKFLTINTTDKSVVSVTQNDVASTVYVLDGVVTAKNLALKEASIWKSQKLTLLRNEATKEDIDLAGKKELITDYIKTDDWFIKNKGLDYLNGENSWTGSTDDEESTTVSSNWGLIEITSHDDEWEVTENSIKIEWRVLSEMVAKIIVNGVSGDIDFEKQTFEVSGVSVPDTENDVVYKVYDDGQELLEKWVLTLYYERGITNNGLDVENIPLSASPLYKFISPKDNPYTTSKEVIMIEWSVPSRTIAKITVNGFILRKFPAYGSYWKYFANKKYWNLKEWLNIYKVEYFWAKGESIYTNAFTIIYKQEEPSTWTWETE